MTWFKVDDGLPFHVKVIRAGNAAIGLWTRSGAWCSQHLTDGVIPADMALTIGTQEEIDRLVKVGLWERIDDENYRFHDWFDSNPSRAEVEAVRERERQKKANARAKRASGPQPSPEDERGKEIGESPSDSGAPIPQRVPEGIPQRVPESVPRGHPEGVRSTRPDPSRPTSVPNGTGPRSAQPTRKPPSSEARPSQPTPDSKAPTGDGDDGSSAQAIVGWWIDQHRQRPPGRLIGQVSRQVKELLGDGFDEAAIKGGLTTMTTKGLNPATLPSLVNEAANRSHLRPVASAGPGIKPWM